MTHSRAHRSECGPVIACGAATVSLSHDPNEPTSIDNLIAALKRLVSTEQKPEPRNDQDAATDPAPVPAHV